MFVTFFEWSLGRMIYILPEFSLPQMSLNSLYRCIASCSLVDGSIVFFWDDKWSHVILAKTFPHLLQFSRNDRISHYYRIRHHCRIWVNWQWCTFTNGSVLENQKMIGAGPKPAVKVHITTCLWLAPVVAWRLLITAGSSQEPLVMLGYHYWF